MLSIRTQDRMALVPYKISIRIKPFAQHGEIKQYNIEYGMTYIIGTYATKERALEVLDEIEIAVRDNQTKLYDYTDFGTYSQTQSIYNMVTSYQMPKE